jgi:hypothetical protein
VSAASPPAHGGAVVRNGRVLVLYRGGHGAPGEGREPGARPAGFAPRFGRELGTFVTAVFIGSLGGLIAGRGLAPWLDAASAGTLALAVGTTLTGAAHAGLVHGQSIRSLLPRVLVAAPLAYLVMQSVHRLAAP